MSVRKELAKEIGRPLADQLITRLVTAEEALAKIAHEAPDAPRMREIAADALKRNSPTQPEEEQR